MKILVISNLYTPYAVGGAERVAQGLAEAMVRRGHQVTVATLGRRGSAPLEVVNGVRVRYLPIRNVYELASGRHGLFARTLWHGVDAFNARAATQIERIVSEERPDLAHTHNIGGFSAAIWQRLRRSKVPCVHTLHDYHLLCVRCTRFADGERCRRICAFCAACSYPRRRLARSLDALVAVSNYTMSVHERMIPEVRRIAVRRVIINGFAAPAEDQDPCNDAPGAARGAAGQVVIGYLGRLVQHKGIEVLLREFRSSTLASRCELLVAGTGEKHYVDRIRGEYEGGGIRFLGQVNASEFLPRVTLLAMPSLWDEPCPLAVGEALTHGCVIIAARRGGIPELICEGTNGVLFDPAIEGDLERAVDEGTRLAAHGDRAAQRRWCREHLGFTRMADEYEELYRRVLGVDSRLPESRAASAIPERTIASK